LSESFEEARRLGGLATVVDFALAFALAQG
jgi:hypothetical protein